MLTECLGVPHISTGDMLRESMRTAHLDERAVAKMQSGGLVRDEVINEMVAERLARADAAKGFILDGYPRTIDQAEHLTTWLDGRGVQGVVIHLAVDYNIIIARLTGRRQCPRCGTLYNVASHPPKRAGFCDLDGETLAIRDDDREDVIRERLDAYDRQTKPVLEFFGKSRHRVVNVETGDESPEAVYQKIRREMMEPAS